jgi:hypothetical protein
VEQRRRRASRDVVAKESENVDQKWQTEGDAKCTGPIPC